MRIVYERVSTDDQTLDSQRDALKRARCREVYEEEASGSALADNFKAASRVYANVTRSSSGDSIGWDEIWSIS